MTRDGSTRVIVGVCCLVTMRATTFQSCCYSIHEVRLVRVRTSLKFLVSLSPARKEPFWSGYIEWYMKAWVAGSCENRSASGGERQELEIEETCEK